VKASNVDASVFIRTTEERHRIAVQHVWVKKHSLSNIESEAELMHEWASRET